MARCTLATVCASTPWAASMMSSAPSQALKLRDTSASADLCVLTLTVASNGTITGACSTGTLLNDCGTNPITPPLTSTTLKTGAKLAVATVFTTGNHGSILDPSGSSSNAATTQEMQRQTANFLKSNGQCLPTGGNCQ